ncbi:MAG: (E)-4-hydroxy-3-methylbut-2-enyl-diphosphate synthase [Candidatus Tectomicrobia bacterium]|uniref:4-hydroxy-3-methylbut-2-en-1-yl diphosphate synthase (flavodoxin) n=1 Tax=Tectimicrobiota bacterium TaxID=2528274 RepID=A0A938B5I3_UNCTE|nr:(E)-4-hydroxy-3-methylbut-2-enyl-diphosphate synthase [Candidatus Tectomicrobia bacterium]
MITLPAYCHDPFSYRRRPTRVVHIGDVPLGGDYPIRVQSMTISDTMDTAATVAETIALVEAGCEIVRITAPSLNEAENLRHIKAALHQRGVRVPLVADIHFTPNAALKAAEYVEKVRINPGNYADKKKFAERDYSESEYQAELERIEERFKPLVLKLKQYGVAMRIGTNHGSLSDRIMNRFGDTPEGMVESALEFVRICQRYDYHAMVLSMKASNPLVMIQAYRLLAARMAEEGMDYPFHLGVTEAGDGEEGRVKSAIGIGALLEDGIGDTIRVSLTEDSVHEIPAAYAIVAPYNRRLASPDTATSLPVCLSPTTPAPQETRNPYGYRRRCSDEIGLGDLQLGGTQPVRVELATTVPLTDIDGTLAQIQALCTPATPGAPVSEMIRLQVQSAADLVAFAQLRQRLLAAHLQVPLALGLPAALLSAHPLPEAAKLVTIPEPTLTADAWRAQARQIVTLVARHGLGLEWALRPETVPSFLQETVGPTLESLAQTASTLVTLTRAAALPNVLVSCEVAQPVPAYRYLAARLDAQGLMVPLHLKTPPLVGREAALFQASLWLGTLLSDGLGDSLLIDSDLPAAEAIRLSYNILQAARLRMSKTEFISCPSCGRTLFNLQTTTERIKTRMSHLKDVKIAIMGCIVNGPGEMADADFGYVGSGPGRISLYVGKECVERNLPQEQADERLIQLIQTHGKWVDPA